MRLLSNLYSFSGITSSRSLDPSSMVEIGITIKVSTIEWGPSPLFRGGIISWIFSVWESFGVWLLEPRSKLGFGLNIGGASMFVLISSGPRGIIFWVSLLFGWRIIWFFLFLLFTRVFVLFPVTFMNPFSLLACICLEVLPSPLQTINLGILAQGGDHVLRYVPQAHGKNDISKAFNILKKRII